MSTYRITFLIDDPEDDDPVGQVWEAVSAVGGYDIDAEKCEQPKTDFKQRQKKPRYE